MTITNNILGLVSKVLPHVFHQLVNLLHGQGDIILIGVTVVCQSLCYPLP